MLSKKQEHHRRKTVQEMLDSSPSCTSMVTYISHDGTVVENQNAMRHPTIVGSMNAHWLFNRSYIFYRVDDQYHSDEFMLRPHHLHLEGQLRKWLVWYSKVMLRRDRKICKKRLRPHELPIEMKQSLMTGLPIIVVDIDGTLKPMEGVKLAGNPMHQATDYLHLMAPTHTIVYLTARGIAMAGITRDWLVNHGFPDGPLIVSKPDAGYAAPILQERYKKNMLNFIQKECNGNIVACYGDQGSDMRAYKSLDPRPRTIERVIDPSIFWAIKFAEQEGPRPQAPMSTPMTRAAPAYSNPRLLPLTSPLPRAFPFALYNMSRTNDLSAIKPSDLSYATSADSSTVSAPLPGAPVL